MDAKALLSAYQDLYDVLLSKSAKDPTREWGMMQAGDWRSTARKGSKNGLMLPESIYQRGYDESTKALDKPVVFLHTHPEPVMPVPSLPDLQYASMFGKFQPDYGQFKNWHMGVVNPQGRSAFRKTEGDNGLYNFISDYADANDYGKDMPLDREMILNHKFAQQARDKGMLDYYLEPRSNAVQTLLDKYGMAHGGYL